MEVEVDMEGVMVGGDNDSWVESVSLAGKEKPVMATTGVGGATEGFVLIACYPDLVEGSKRVENKGLEASDGPKGQRTMRKMKERVLKVVINKLVLSLISFKPTGNGPSDHSGLVVRDSALLKNKAQVAKGQFSSIGSAKEDGSDLRVGPNSTSSPDLNKKGEEGTTVV